jgi:peptidyl-prolyl cis-trans isomerase B (cyclophilin B)
MIAALVLALVGDPKVTAEFPPYFVPGQAYKVHLTLEAPADGANLEGWQVTPAAFSVDGKALGEKGKQAAMALKAGEKPKTIEVDLGPSLKATADFDLTWGSLPPGHVRVLEAAPKDLKFTDDKSVPAADLTKYWVLMQTNRGDILLEFWPDVAPNHVRNFLDLSATGFYNGVTFHRVMPGFMIQGGDPDGTGSGHGPRTLKAEFNAKKHVRGVLSMARSNSPDSASSQFFIMHAEASSLDGQYSGFGKVVAGMATVDRIVSAPGTPLPGAGGTHPTSPQVMQNVIVVKAPADPTSWYQTK